MHAPLTVIEVADDPVLGPETPGCPGGSVTVHTPEGFSYVWPVHRELWVVGEAELALYREWAEGGRSLRDVLGDVRETAAQRGGRLF